MYACTLSIEKTYGYTCSMLNVNVRCSISFLYPKTSFVFGVCIVTRCLRSITSLYLCYDLTVLKVITLAKEQYIVSEHPEEKGTSKHPIAISFTYACAKRLFNTVSVILRRTPIHS